MRSALPDGAERARPVAGEQARAHLRDAAALAAAAVRVDEGGDPVEERVVLGRRGALEQRELVADRGGRDQLARAAGGTSGQGEHGLVGGDDVGRASGVTARASRT